MGPAAFAAAEAPSGQDSRALLFFGGGGGEAEAALSDVQLRRIPGADLLRQLRHAGGVSEVAAAGLKGKQGARGDL